MVVNQLAPVVKTVEVNCSPKEAFRVFTEHLGSWWPTRTHSGGGDKVSSVTMECRLGGRVFETLEDGTEFDWALITDWEPPRRFAMDWSPSATPTANTHVEVRFEPAPTGSRVELTHTGWERLGDDALSHRNSYDEGWDPVLVDFVGVASRKATR